MFKICKLCKAEKNTETDFYKIKNSFSSKCKECISKDNKKQFIEKKEFFIQKAAGWALRQYSRVDPIGVSSFISKHQLPPLTKREGMRLILKEEGKW